jgi:hypothetical protein
LLLGVYPVSLPCFQGTDDIHIKRYTATRYCSNGHPWGDVCWTQTLYHSEEYFVTVCVYYLSKKNNEIYNSKQKVWRAPHKPYFCVRYFRDRVSVNYLPEVASSSDLPYLFLLSSWHYRRQPQAPGSSFVFSDRSHNFALAGLELVILLSPPRE